LLLAAKKELQLGKASRLTVSEKMLHALGVQGRALLAAAGYV